MNLSRRAFFEAVNRHLERLRLSPDVLSAYPHELSGRHASARRHRARHGVRAGVHHRRRADDRPRRRRAEGRAGDDPRGAAAIRLVDDLRHARSDGARQHRQPPRHHVRGPAGRGGPTAEIFHEPLHPYTAHLIASLPRIGDLKPKAALPGAPPSLADPPSGCRFHPRCPLAMDICKQVASGHDDGRPRPARRLFRGRPAGQGGRRHTDCQRSYAEADAAARLGQ